MKKTHDVTAIVAFSILILFIISCVIYILLQSNTNTHSSLPETDIYSQHSHQTVEEENLTSTLPSKTYEGFASYTTKIYDKDENRIYNIKLAAERLDGHLVSPR